MILDQFVYAPEYAVIFTYSFDTDASVFLFDKEEDALTFLRESYDEECRIEREENGWEIESEISTDGRYARIVYRPDEISEDVCEYHLVSIVYKKK